MAVESSTRQHGLTIVRSGFDKFNGLSVANTDDAYARVC